MGVLVAGLLVYGLGRDVVAVA